MQPLRSCLGQKSIGTPIKSVRFTDNTADFQLIPADICSWADGEVWTEPPEHMIRNAQKLTKVVISKAKTKERRERWIHLYRAVKSVSAKAKVLVEKKMKFKL